MACREHPEFDQTYISRDYDMRWFSAQEICEIMSRFQRVHVLGNSLMVNLFMAPFILPSGDVGHGG
jgi:hypothetical protein